MFSKLISPLSPMAGVILEMETAVRRILNVRRVHTTRSRVGSVESFSLEELCRCFADIKQEFTYQGRRISEKNDVIAQHDDLISKKNHVISEKDHIISEKDKVINENLKRIEELEQENQRLQQAAGKLARPITTSDNSSLPSSKNPIGVKHTKSLREKSTRKSGGQLGHVGETRQLIDNPDSIEYCLSPSICPSCGTSLVDFPEIKGEVRQVIDIPSVIVPIVKEFIQMKKICKCGHCSKGEFPQEAKSTVCYGPIVEATVAYMSTYQTIPFKRLSDLMKNLFSISMSQGTISNILGRMRKNAQYGYEKIRCSVEQSPVVGADETSVIINGERYWLWTFQTELASYLYVNKGRGRIALDSMFPKGFPNSTLVSDRLSLYFNVETIDHQICLAHLLRNTMFFVEYLPKEKWPKKMIKLLRESIHFRKTQGVNSSEAERFKERFDELMDEEILLKETDKQKEFNSFRKGIRKHRENIFTFLTNPLVPYDNNASERSLRPVKTKLKVSGQFKSDHGAEEYATLQSIIQTAKKNEQEPLLVLLAVARYKAE